MRVIEFILIIILIMFNNNLSQEIVWKYLEGPYGGTVGSIVINKSGTLFAGTYSYNTKGAYKSNDDGKTWIKLATEFPEFEVYSLLVTSEDHIWIGTTSSRLYRSTNNGLTWENKSSSFVGECWALGESKNGTLFAGNADDGYLFRSTNNGDNWQFIRNNIFPLSFAADSGNKIYMGTAEGLFYSTDNGLNWSRNNAFPNYFVSSILIDSNNIIYCATGYSYTNGDGVFYSTDNGNSWSHMGLSTKAILSLAFDSEGKLYAGSKNEGIYVTGDKGKTWGQLEKGLYRKHITKLIINKNDEIFVGSEGGGEGLDVYAGGGVFRSTDNGNSFEHVGLPFTKVNNIALSKDSLIFSSTSSGVQEYNKINKKWRNIGLQNVSVVNITQSGYLYAGTDIGLYKKHISVEEWEYLEISQDTLLRIYNVYNINDDTIFVATDNNLRSTTNGGLSWNKLNLSTGDFRRGLFYKNGDLFVSGASLFKSTDFGSTFSIITTGIGTYSHINPISILENGDIYLSSRGSTYNGIIKSTDGGSNWQNLYQSDRVTTTIYADEYGIIISGLFGQFINKIIFSNNYGNSWNEFLMPTNNGTAITGIKKNSLNEYYIGTSGEGLFNLEIITSMDEVEINTKNFYLLQNYPNPFNPSTEIRYQIAEDSKVSLMVYDVLGNEVATLVNEKKSAGSYNIIFDASKLSSGVYYYKLVVGEFVSVKKMILLK